MASEARVRNPWKSELFQLSFLYFVFYSFYRSSPASIILYLFIVPGPNRIHFTQRTQKICLAPKFQGFVTRWVVALKWYPGGVDANPVDWFISFNCEYWKMKPAKKNLLAKQALSREKRRTWDWTTHDLWKVSSSFVYLKMFFELCLLQLCIEIKVILSN